MLSGDLDLARDNHVRASPTLLCNEGRQRLTGNVGYRVLVANVRELLQAPTGGQLWCCARRAAEITAHRRLPNRPAARARVRRRQ